MKTERVYINDFWVDRYDWGFAIGREDRQIVDYFWHRDQGMYAITTTETGLMHEDETIQFGKECMLLRDRLEENPPPGWEPLTN